MTRNFKQETPALLNIVEAGQEIVSSLYGGTYNLLHYTFPKIGAIIGFGIKGGTPEFVRLSIGLENIDDILTNLDEALKKI